MSDKGKSAGSKKAEAGGKLPDDLRQRIRELAAETSAANTEKNISDGLLVDRVRVAIGRIPANHETIGITSHHGIVTLSGEASANELPAVLAAVREVAGVREIVSELKVHEEPDQLIPPLARGNTAG